MGLFTKILGDPNEKIIKSLQPIIDEINGLEPVMKKKSDSELKAMTAELKAKVASDKDNEPALLNEILPLAFAAVREAAQRILGQRHYDVQLIGGIILHRGQITEMRTGEGKTLVATLPLYLNALTGRGVHLVTVNDYLSQVGAGWMAPVYYALGMSVGVIVHDTAFIYDPEFKNEAQYDKRLSHFRPIERREAYACDILYGTNNEFGFDYLRDNMAPNLLSTVQRELHYAIVDEVDSILIDEARTPLIISAPAEESTDKYRAFSQLVRRLKENDDYNVDEKMRAATLTEAGITKMEKWLGVDNIYTSGGIREVHHIEQALKAYTLFKLDRDYVVKEGEVIIVDEFTGRLMHGRRYSEGLHQAIEAKEGVAVQRESQTLATITFQNYFRMYDKLAGMTGTAMTEAEEFSKIYSLETMAIPTHKPMIRVDKNDLIYRTEAGKFEAVVKDIKERQKQGQPILVGTISITKNELLKEMMERSGLEPQLLNAKNHEKEAKIIAQAGKVGAITLATNMAGRGVDIMLGGAEPPYAPQGGATEGKPAYTSPRPSLSQEEGESNMASGVETKESEEHKEWREERAKVIELGGLHVIGTERHEARRIDNQLRGRSGRQGDPGSSRFYVSTEDDLMRIFGGDRMKNLMTTLRVPEDMPIENKMISKSIESAQRKVEGNNFDIRKHLVEYDDVINKHREAIYRKRLNILRIADSNSGAGEKEESGISVTEPAVKAEVLNKSEVKNSLAEIIFEMVENEIEQVVSAHTAAEQLKDWNLAEIYQVAATIFPVAEKLKGDLSEFTENGNQKLDKAEARTAIIVHLNELARNNYDKLEKQARERGVNWLELEKAVLIRSIDTLWVEHLEAMSSVRQGIGLRGYGQRDPLIEYKKEAYHLYNELNSLIQKEVVYSIFKVGAVYGAGEGNFTAPGLAQRAKQFSAPAKTMDQNTSSFSGFKEMAANSGSQAGATSSEGDDRTQAARVKAKDAAGKKVGRNDPCPCGSGEKYKKCCGK